MKERGIGVLSFLFFIEREEYPEIIVYNQGYEKE